MPCDKRPYPGAPSAKAAARSAHWRIHTYWCVECRAWHIANAEKDKKYFKRRKADRWPHKMRARPKYRRPC